MKGGKVKHLGAHGCLILRPGTPPPLHGNPRQVSESETPSFNLSKFEDDLRIALIAGLNGISELIGFGWWYGLFGY